MGEEKKTEEEVKKSEVNDVPKKDEVEEAAAVEEIVLKVDMHCQACARKIIRALHGFQGVEEVTADSKASKVFVKGKTADPLKLCQRIQSKSRRKAEIISPLPIPTLPHPPKEEQQQQQHEQPIKELQPAVAPPPAAAAVVTVVVLSVRMHCEACAQGLRKRIRKIPGVEAVTTDLVRDQVMVKGVIDPEKIVDDVYKKTGKHVSIVKGEDEEKKEKGEGEKKEEGEGEKKEECRGETEDEKKNEIKKVDYVPSRYYTEYAFAYPSQMFSDENPNACSVM